MKKTKHLLFSLLCLCVSTLAIAQKQFSLKAPDGKLQLNVYLDQQIQYSLNFQNEVLLDKSTLSMQLDNGAAFGVNPKLRGSKTQSVNTTIDAVVYKRNKIVDQYNELILNFKDYEIIFRAYNEGVAYRFVSKLKAEFKVTAEQAEFNFPANQKAYIPYVRHQRNSLQDQFYNSFENYYTYSSISDWDNKRLAFLPILVEATKGKKIAIAEADLLSYPGMYLHNANGSTSLKAMFAPVPKEVEQGGHNMLQGVVKSAENYIASCKGSTQFPWRILIVSEQDFQLADNDLIYKLATPANAKHDFSWIKPGKVAWDWWNDWNVKGVNFRAGINNDTYKYYIDFASANKIEYVILDEGWAVNKAADLMQVVDEIDLEELIEYANKKQVGLILWAGYYALNRDIEGICKHYSEMGIKGFKVDFMDRDDQPMVDFHSKTAEIAAKYHLLIDFHGTYKPTGLQRTYPNVINFEGVNGLEQLKWARQDDDHVTYDVTAPFIRMLAGPMDYTQGAMRNATRANFRAINSEPMSQGTRCRQLAEYIIFESPLNMLCDNPSSYMQEKESTQFIAEVPTTWDQSVALNGVVGQYISIARKKGNVWYVGGLTNWDARTLELDLNFLDSGAYLVEIFKDGVNADRVASDYTREVINLSADRKIKISMAKGGGFVLKISKKI